jgi:ribonucleoside-diphosphate reductase alpha chain
MSDLNVRQNVNKSELMEPQLSDNAKYIAKTRYSMKAESGEMIEDVKDIFWRVASSIAKGDLGFGKSQDEVEVLAKDFYNLMAEQKFLPNTPCLVNAGKQRQQLSACFVLPIDDSMDSILETMSNMAKIHKSGGGTGFSFSRLRPSGDYIKTSGGTTVGPVSFMQAYNDVTAQIKQGGVRRGANMGMLSIDHPDVLRFAVVKLDEWSLTNFNISLAVTNDFMLKVESDKKFLTDDLIPEDVVEEIKEAEAIRSADVRLREVEVGIKKLYEWAEAKSEGEGYELINPRNGQVAMKLNAAKVFNLVTRLAWQFGDPGLVFIDRMNEPSSNPIPSVGKIEATNPCGEQPLLPYDACNLGSVNLAKLVVNKDINWEELKRVVFVGVHFLDNVVEINEFPVPQIREMVTNSRRIGLGIMGFADALFKLGIKYDSDEGIAWSKKIMKFVTDTAKEATCELAKVRGVFPYWNVSVFANTEYRPRNMALTTIAPTGTISMIADASSGIEPVFSLAFQKNTVEGKTLYLVNPVLVDELKKRNIYSDELIEKIVKNSGSLKDMEEVPKEIRDVFITALEIDPEWHIKVQAAFQEFTDNAVSKTINLPETATVDDVRTAYRMAYSLGTKGITIYRTGSRSFEPLQKVKDKSKESNEKTAVVLPKKKPTPIIANGTRVKKKCDVGSVYTSIFYEEGDGPVEVFVNLGKSGGYLAASAEVTGRLASLALKYGATLDEISEQLVGISCGQKFGMGNGAVLSMFDAVGKSLLEISKGEQLTIFGDHPEVPYIDVAKKSEEITQAESKFGACPDCGSPLRAEEGCYKCTNQFCGYSKCS